MTPKNYFTTVASPSQYNPVDIISDSKGGPNISDSSFSSTTIPSDPDEPVSIADSLACSVSLHSEGGPSLSIANNKNSLDEKMLEDANTPMMRTPSNLDRSTAMGEIMNLKSDQFKGILKKRATELNARRQKAEMLLRYATKLNREELKVVALETKAIQALTNPPLNRRPLDNFSRIAMVSENLKKAIHRTSWPSASAPSPKTRTPTPVSSVDVSNSAIVQSTGVPRLEDEVPSTVVAVAVATSSRPSSRSQRSSARAKSVTRSSQKNLSPPAAVSSTSHRLLFDALSGMSGSSSTSIAASSPSSLVELRRHGGVESTNYENMTPLDIVSSTSHTNKVFDELSELNCPLRAASDASNEQTKCRSHSSISTETAARAFNKDLSSRDTASSNSSTHSSHGNVDGDLPSSVSTSPVLTKTRCQSGISNSPSTHVVPPNVVPYAAPLLTSGSCTLGEMNCRQSMDESLEEISIASSFTSASRYRNTPDSSQRRLRVHSRASTSDGAGGGDASVSDLSDIETRLSCLYSNLREQEALLAKIDKQCKHAHKDRLVRLERTLLQHKKFCTDLIQRIKGDIRSCHSSMCETFLGNSTLHQSEIVAIRQSSIQAATHSEPDETVASPHKTPSLTRAADERECTPSERGSSANNYLETSRHSLSSASSGGRPPSKSQHARSSISSVKTNQITINPSDARASNSCDNRSGSQLAVSNEGPASSPLSGDKSACLDSIAKLDENQLVNNESKVYSDPKRSAISKSARSRDRDDSSQPGTAGINSSSDRSTSLKHQSTSYELSVNIKSDSTAHQISERPAVITHLSQSGRNSAASDKSVSSIQSRSPQYTEDFAASGVSNQSAAYQGSVDDEKQYVSNKETSLGDSNIAAISGAREINSAVGIEPHSQSKSVHASGGSDDKLMNSEVRPHPITPKSSLQLKSGNRNLSIANSSLESIPEAFSQKTVSDAVTSPSCQNLTSLSRTSTNKPVLTDAIGRSKSDVGELPSLSEPNLEASSEGDNVYSVTFESEAAVLSRQTEKNVEALRSETPEIQSGRSSVDILPIPTDDESDLSIALSRPVPRRRLESPEDSTESQTVRSACFVAAASEELEFPAQSTAAIVSKVLMVDSLVTEVVGQMLADVIERAVKSVQLPKVDADIDLGVGDDMDEISFQEETMILREDIMGLIANTASRMVPFFHQALDFFWHLRESCERGTYEAALRKARYPVGFGFDYIEDEDFELAKTVDMGFINRSMFFDSLREHLQYIYDGEDEDLQNDKKPVISSARYRLWLGSNRPNNLESLERIVRPKLEADLGVCLSALPPGSASGVAALPSRVVMDPDRLHRLTQWSLRRKGWLDQLLEVEMRADEVSWINYRPYEKEVVETFSKAVVLELFEATFDKCQKQIEMGKSSRMSD